MLGEDIRKSRLAGGGFRCFQDDFCRREFRVTAQPLARGAFSWELEHFDFGQFQLTELACDPLEISHTHSDIREDGTSSYYVTLQLAGRSIVSQQGRNSSLGPGDYTIVDSRFPYKIKYDEPVRRVILRLPHDVLHRRLKFCGNPVAVRFHGNSGINAIFVNFIDTLLRERHAINKKHFDMLFGRVSDFLIASFESTDVQYAGLEKSTRQANQLGMIQNYIEGNISNPELSPKLIADAFNITDRYLHYLFKATGQTVANWIWQRRLERCQADLSNAGHSGRTISEICYAWGFNDSAHFSRKFKQHFGISPRSFRNSLTLPQRS